MVSPDDTQAGSGLAGAMAALSILLLGAVAYGAGPELGSDDIGFEVVVASSRSVDLDGDRIGGDEPVGTTDVGPASDPGAGQGASGAVELLLARGDAVSFDQDDRSATPHDLQAEARALLAARGVPVGSAAAAEGEGEFRRSLCAWRRLEGRGVSRDPLAARELIALRKEPVPIEAPSGRGAVIDKACQAVYVHEGGQWSQIHAASTGRGGLPRVADYEVVWKRPGWHTSTLYPAPEPNMYNAIYFSGPIAIHGSNHVPPHPASAGCTRVTPAAAELIFSVLQVGDPIRVIDVSL